MKCNLALVAFALLLAGCAGLSELEGPLRKETIYAVTEGGALVHFNAGRPQRLLGRKAVSGLQPGERLLGIDYRVARGVLFALGSSGRLYTLNVQSGAATQVGQPLATRLEGDEFGFDFNPVVDRIRVVSSSGQNLRLHPDTGAVVDSDPNTPGVQIDGRLAYAASDANAGKASRIMAAGYTYNKTNDKITTNYAIDGALGLLVLQGSREGASPAVSPNTGQLFTVGPLGTGALARVAFDIADINNAAFAATTVPGAGSSRLHLVSLETGTATFIGTIGGGEPVRGIAIEP